MEIFKGISYNLRGLMMGLSDRRLLFWGASRFVLILLCVVLLGGLVLGFHEEMMAIIWQRPESGWLAWIWQLVSWSVSLFLLALSFLISYLISQILFSVLIMDHMSRIVEKKLKGKVVETGSGIMRFFFYLVRQEVPRTVFPLAISLIMFILGWLIMLGPISSLFSASAAAVFLAWDNTDIVPARRLIPFRERFRLLLRSLSFHLGFGLPFLIPFLNIVFLAFAPVGGTLYFLEREELS
jgi:CysZ protein